MTGERVVTEAIEVIWNRGELDRIPEFYRESFVSHQPPLGARWDPGHEGLRQLVSRTRARFPDYHETIEDVVAAGDRVVLRLTNRGTDLGGSRSTPPSGRSFEVRDFMLVRVEGGRIAEQWGLVDLYSMYVQLGSIEPRRPTTRSRQPGPSVSEGGSAAVSLPGTTGEGSWSATS